MSLGDSHDAIDLQKRHAAREALERFVEPGMTVGLGSGSTAAHFIDLLGQRLADGSLHSILGVATSRSSEELARAAGIPLVEPDQTPGCDVVIDGADEVSPTLDLIKGLGGALVREKVVAQSSAKRVIIVDASKLVAALGTKALLPVEVMTWSGRWQEQFLRDLGGEPVLRVGKNGQPFVTDNGNRIYDVKFGKIADPAQLEMTLLRRAGVVQTGLFLGLADVVLVARPDGVEVIERSSR